MTGSIIKCSPKGRNFTIASNDFIRDEKLSMQAKGLLVYILSLPPDWQIYVSELPRHFTNGICAVRNTIKELEENGYIVRKERRDGKGHFIGYTFIISETRNELIKNT